MADPSFFPVVDSARMVKLREEEMAKAQEQQRIEAEAQQRQQQQETQQKEQQLQQQLVSPLPQPRQPGAPLEGVAKWMEENVYIPAADMLDNLTGDRKSPEQIAQERQQVRTETEQKFQEVDEQIQQGFAYEATTAIAGAFAKPIEGVIDLGYQAYLDQTVNKGLKPTDEAYKRAYTQLVNSPKTDAGQAAERILSFVMMARALRNVPGAKLGTKPMPKDLKGASWLAAKGKRAVLEGIVPGAISDFLLTDAKDGNMMAVIKDLVPENYRDAFIFALATDKYGDPWLNRVKSAGEGAMLNPVFNVGIDALVGGYKVARSLIKKGASPEEAVAQGVNKIAELSDELGVYAKASKDESNRLVKALSDQTNEVEEEIMRLQMRVREASPEDAAKLTDELNNLRQRQQDLVTEMENLTDPSTKQFDFENSRVDKAENINTVVKNQLLMEEGIPGKGRVSIHAASGRVLTESAVKSAGIEGGALKILKKYEQDVDVLRISKESGLTTGQVLENAAKIYQGFLDSMKSFDEIYSPTEGDLVKRLMSESGELLVGSKRGTLGASAETIIASKAIIADWSNELYRLSQLAEEADTRQFANFNYYERLTDRFIGLLEFYKTGTQFLGGSLNALRLSLVDNVSAREALQYMAKEETDEDAVVTLARLRKFAQEAKDAYRRGDADGLEKMRTLTRAMVLSGGDPAKAISFGDTARAVALRIGTRNFYNSILSGAKTLFRNGGTFYRLVEAPTSIALRGAFTGDKALINSGLAGYSSIITGMGEAWKVARQTMRTGIPIQTTPKQFMQRTETLAMLENLEKTATTASEQRAVGHLKWHYRMAEYLAVPEKVMMGMDDYFKTILVRQRINELAAYKAYQEDPSNWKGAMEAKLKEYSNAIDPQTGVIKSKALQEYADIGTFQSDPGEMINSFSRFVETVPGGKLVVPFIRTPANIMTYQFEHLPLTNLASRNYQKAMKSGDPVLIAEYEGRQAIGLLAMGSAYMMAANNMITGDWPNPVTEKEEFKRWKELGIQPRSLRFGDTYVSYSMVEPLSNLIAISANLARVVQTYGLSEDFADKFMGMGVLSIVSSVTEKSYFSGIAAMADLADPENWTGEKTVRGLLSTLNNIMPLASMRRGIGNSLDPYLREYNDEFDRSLQSALPIYRNFRPAMISVFTGKPMKNPNGGLWNANVPFEINTQIKDPIIDMLADIDYKWKDDLDRDKTGVRLTAEQKNKIRTSMFESGLRSELEAEMKKGYFKEDLDNWRNRRLGPDREYFRSERPKVYDNVSKIWNKHREIAFTRLAQEDAAFATQLQGLGLKKQQLENGNYQLDKPQKFYSTMTNEEGERLQRLMNY